jgi:hypothetical protein
MKNRKFLNFCCCLLSGPEKSRLGYIDSPVKSITCMENVLQESLNLQSACMQTEAVDIAYRVNPLHAMLTIDGTTI